MARNLSCAHVHPLACMLTALSSPALVKVELLMIIQWPICGVLTISSFFLSCIPCTNLGHVICFISYTLIFYKELLSG